MSFYRGRFVLPPGGLLRLLPTGGTGAATLWRSFDAGRERTEQSSHCSQRPRTRSWTGAGLRPPIDGKNASGMASLRAGKKDCPKGCLP